jgi:hypothetical protein
MEAAKTGPSYTVKNIDAIAEGSDTRARLSLGRRGQWGSLR